MTLAMTSSPVARAFRCFLNVCLHSRSFPLRADWQKSDSSVDGEPQLNWRRNSNSRDVVASSASFSRPPHQIARRLALKGLAVWPLSSSYLNIICQLRFPIRSLCTMKLNVNDEITYTRQKMFWEIIFIFHSIWWHFFSVTISNKIRDAAPLQCP